MEGEKRLIAVSTVSVVSRLAVEFEKDEVYLESSWSHFVLMSFFG